jgi:hypothetical protein
MQQVADWLKKLGMSEYAERFVENDIDMAVLPDLTDQHLKDLGVSLGHRLKMLRAIRDLSGAPVAGTAPLAPVATQPTQRHEAERRQLTVMFCDLVGSQQSPLPLRRIIAYTSSHEAGAIPRSANLSPISVSHRRGAVHTWNCLKLSAKNRQNPEISRQSANRHSPSVGLPLTARLWRFVRCTSCSSICLRLIA